MLCGCFTYWDLTDCACSPPVQGLLYHNGEALLTSCRFAGTLADGEVLPQPDSLGERTASQHLENHWPHLS